MVEDEDQTLVLSNMQKVLEKTDDDAKHTHACLLGVGGELNGTLLDLKPGITKIGRAKDTNHCLGFDGISRYHFYIDLNAQTRQARIRDMGSSNGTFVNNERISGSVELKKGDVIKVGVVAFQFIPPGDPERLTYDHLTKAANTDELTGCFNKAYFLKALDTAVKKSKVTQESLSLIVFDIDHFKKLNDGYGHDAGDYVLHKLGGLIRRSGIREGDVIARYGGEEFVVLLPARGVFQAAKVAERIREMVESHPFTYDLSELEVTVSLGVAQLSPQGMSPKALFKQADQALYEAKSNGRNQVSLAVK